MNFDFFFIFIVSNPTSFMDHADFDLKMLDYTIILIIWSNYNKV